MAMSLLLPLSSAIVPSASLAFTTGTRSSRTSSSSSSVAVNVTNASTTIRSGLLHCSFTSSSTTLSFQQSSFSGLSFGVNLQFNKGREKVPRFVVRAGKAALCLTKRNRSRKSLARTHGFRKRMSTTSGRAIIKRRRAKGRKILCTKTNPRRVSNGSK